MVDLCDSTLQSADHLFVLTILKSLISGQLTTDLL